VSQPFDRGSHLNAPGSLDQSLGEFWVENPWDIVSRGHNLSAYERKRVFLNVGGHDFLDVSGLTGADSDGDGRSVVAADFRNNGQLDILIRQVGGGAVMLFENHFPRRHYLTVSLRGRKSNSLGIGARIKALVGGRFVVRELFPQNTHRSQMPAQVHFGLGDADVVDRLTIRWPSGTVQELTNLAADRHVMIDEGVAGPAAVETVTPGQTFRP
jgi:enediyne biosynthesis protein E4